MKKILSNKLFAAILFVVLVSAIACKKYTEVQPVSTFNLEQAFSDPGNAFLAVLGAYDEMSGESGFSLNLSMVFPFDSDEGYSSSSVTATNGAIARYQAPLNNTPLVNSFRALYRGVERTNLCIERIPLMSQYTNGTASEKKDLRRLHGEVLALRALYYFELIKNWGDVPAPMIPAYKQTSLFIEPSNRDSTYSRIIDDLIVAKDLLPWRTEAPRNTRITKGAAKALLARIALFRGGFSLRSNGKMERPADFLKFYQIALTECSDLMANRTQHTLNPNFEQIWRNLTSFVYDPQGEILLEMGSAGNDGNSDSRQGNFNGPVLNSASRFGVGSGSIRVTPNYFYAFDSVDTRRDVTITLYSVPTSSNIKSTRRIGELTTGKYRRDWRVPLVPGAAINISLNWSIIRFSDVLLMFAEAANEINNGPTPAAIAAFEEVRKRGFRGNVSAIGTTPTTKSGFFDAIVNERFLEFGEEGIRKYDLIRWNLLTAKIEEARLRITQIRDRVAPYTSVPQYVYYKNNGEELQWFSTTNNAVNAMPFYTPTQVPTPASEIGTATNPATKWVRIDWAQNLTATAYESATLDKNLAKFFTPGKSELFPFDQVTLDAYQGKLKQNPGY
jgi:starch-binding outer membrane protein, SusD/RagB family